MKIVTKEFRPNWWTAFIEGEMMPYPAHGETEAEAVRNLRAGLKRRLHEREAECEDISNALSVLFRVQTRIER